MAHRDRFDGIGSEMGPVEYGGLGSGIDQVVAENAIDLCFNHDEIFCERKRYGGGCGQVRGRRFWFRGRRAMASDRLCGDAVY